MEWLQQSKLVGEKQSNSAWLFCSNLNVRNSTKIFLSRPERDCDQKSRHICKNRDTRHRIFFRDLPDQMDVVKESGRRVIPRFFYFKVKLCWIANVSILTSRQLWMSVNGDSVPQIKREKYLLTIRLDIGYIYEQGDNILTLNFSFAESASSFVVITDLIVFVWQIMVIWKFLVQLQKNGSIKYFLGSYAAAPIYRYFFVLLFYCPFEKQLHIFIFISCHSFFSQQ